MQTRRPPLKRGFWSVRNAGIAVFLLFSLFSVVERIHLANGKTYPRILATAELGYVDHAAIVRLRKTTCSHDIIEIYKKKNSVVLRCGIVWVMPSTRTYIAKSADL